MNEHMSDAAILISPHGAGLGNIYMLSSNAIVVEIGYTGKKGMSFPETYYQEWSHSCNNTHIVVTGSGEYGSPMRVDLDTLDRVFTRIIVEINK